MRDDMNTPMEEDFTPKAEAEQKEADITGDREKEQKTSEKEEPSSIEYGPGSYYPKPPRSQKSTGRIVPLIVSLCLVFSLLTGVGGMLIGKYFLTQTPPATNGESGGNETVSPSGTGNVVMQKTDESAATLTGGMTAVVEKCADSVVEIRTEVEGVGFIGGTKSGAGSGVIVGENTETGYSYIVTNNHVVEGDFSAVTVRTTDGEELDAELVGTDWMSDIAVLRVKQVGLTKAVWAKSSTLLQGQQVAVIGNPLGALGGSVTGGIISGLERTITIDGIPMTLLQIDAAVNPGNSGGGLFDMNGNLIGVVNAKSVGSNIDNIGFAIPADYAVEMVSEICEKGYVSGRVDLGFSFMNSSTSSLLSIYSYAFGDTTDTEIKQGDILYSLSVGTEEIKLESLSDYRGVLAKLKIGDTVKATIYRPSGWRYVSYTVTLTAHESRPGVS